MLKVYASLTKFRIGVFVLFSGVAGYFLSIQSAGEYSSLVFITFLFGLYWISAGSFILNQAQEREIDKKMKRTKNRPVPTGQISVYRAYFFGVAACVFGSFLLLILNPLAMVLGLVTIFFYNVVYTFFWKPRFKYAAVPGAIPGAFPPVIGYVVGGGDMPFFPNVSICF